MLLKNLIKNIPANINNIEISNLASDSRKVKKGCLFFALQGSKLDGNNFITQAVKKGAKAIVCSRKIKTIQKKIPIIRVENTRESLGYACSKFFDKKPENIIAVTGTNGKSSVAEFFYQILEKNNYSVASIGTLGIKFKNKLKSTNLTSLDVISLHKELFILKKLGINNVIIEASSHGLAQGRMNGIDFKIGIFTNFSQDHLDYHKNMKNYFNSKMILFSKLLKNKKIIIADKEIREFSKLKKIAKRKKLILKTIDENNFINLKQFPLIGKFQVKNLTMALLAAKISGLSLKKINSVLSYIKSVNGRLELIRILSNQTKIFIDYAHTPHALETALQSLKDHFKNNISLVFGCGGERDKKKRGVMARIASKFCTKIYVTDDNPRNENPKKIRRMIIKELKRGTYKEIGNRSNAIKFAIHNSDPFEIILIAGKGHETSQDYGKKTIKISDKSIIKKIHFNKKDDIKNLNSIIIKKITKRSGLFKFKGVSINSKNIKKGNLFIAIKGKKKDGHNYVKEALKKGANYCVVAKNVKTLKKKKFIRCSNTKVFLNKLAFLKRCLTKAIIIGVTGSSGKTTLKTLLGQTLNNFGSTYFSPKSYNNHYGVPLSLSNIEYNHDYGVFEIGMSKSGEINKLSKLVKPNIGIITNVAQAHIENFKNIKGIAKAKSEIIRNINRGGFIVLNRDDNFFKYFRNISKNKGLKILSFGKSVDSDICLISNNKNILKIKVYNQILFLKIKNNNITNIYNILACIAVVKILKLDLNKVKKIFQTSLSLSGRGKIHNVKRYKTQFRLIDESYNANPLSVKNAIINLSNMKAKNCKKYILLGDMLELGNKSDFYHKNLSKIINNTDIDKVFVYGDKILKTYKYTLKKKQGNILQYKNDFDEIFPEIIKRNDYLMIKGSNETGLSKLSNSIIKGKSHAI